MKMDRCQHNEKIVRFCASECCAWKQASGCSTCIKKYHNHMGPSVFVQQSSIDSLLRKYKAQHLIKPKVQFLEQYLHSYFDSLKVKLISYIDELDKKMRTELCYPYLSKHGLVQMYKRLKKREYRKVTQKEFRVFYQATQKLDSGEYNCEERRLYEEAVKRYAAVFQRFTELVGNLEKAVNGVEQAVQMKVDKGFEGKVKNVFDQITSGKLGSSTQQSKEDIIAAAKREEQKKTSKPQPTVQPQQPPSLNQQSSNLLKIPSVRTRTKSFDTSMNNPDTMTSSNPDQMKQAQASDYNKKQRQLSEMKRKLLHLMSEKTGPSQQVHPTHHHMSVKGNLQTTGTEKITITQPSPEREKKHSPSQTKKYSPTKQKRFSEVNMSLLDGDNQGKKNFLNVEEAGKDKDLNASTQSINVADNLFKMPLARQISEIKHNKLPSQETQKILLQQERKQNSPKKHTRAIVVPVKAEFPIQPAQYSPLVKRKKQAQANLDAIMELKPVQQVERKDSKKQQLPLHTLSENQQKSIQLLTESIKRKTDQAVPLLLKALTLAPGNLSAAEYLSFLYLQTGSAVQCLKICNNIIQQLQGEVVYDINSINIHNNKAVALIMLGRYSQAIPLLQRCMQIKQIDRLYKNLADAFFQIGIYEKATYNYEKAIALNGNFAEAHYNLAVCMYYQENYFNALLSVEKALKLSPKAEGYAELRDQIKLKTEK